ncbi:hypothetical protein P8942_03760 [Enterococcus faecium]|uniref:hypothetical protein n=1 Tax=Enterococcus faecium TaxID=1352 RepID=UPI0009BFAA7C|nr:hypothetical protein [Enterococcus faecium]EJC3743709.1 hypothetical protein [Enterococcus faecium]EMF0280298.1 hypothetical protein [Enterococcus faecium]MDG4588986.1 hypothetical protein [Enterococcus faecium]OQO65852.1 hypothetical protein BH743_07230 [Enterococcus faecium]
MMIDLKTGVIVILLFGSLLLIGIGLVTKATGGLFWSRPPQNYFQDRNNPNFEEERRVGNRLSNTLLKYIPPISIGLLVILILILLNIL